MALPSASEIRSHLEGYNITSSKVSDSWINDERDEVVVPYVEDQVGFSLESEDTKIDYHSGNGRSVLYLNRRGITEIVSVDLVRASDIIGTISLSSFELNSDEGFLKAVSNFSEGIWSVLFPKGDKNIKVTYTIGGTLTTRLNTIVKKFTCISMLDLIEGRTGGGSLGVQAFNRNYGDKGKYTNIRGRLNKAAVVLLRKFQTGVTGS